MIINKSRSSHFLLPDVAWDAEICWLLLLFRKGTCLGLLKSLGDVCEGNCQG